LPAAFVLGAQQPFVGHSAPVAHVHCWFARVPGARQSWTPVTPVGAQQGLAALVQSELVVHLTAHI
jgi:hypothetical protein